MKKLTTVFAVVALFAHNLRAQSTYLPTDADGYHLLERYIVLHPDSLPFQTTIKPFNRELANRVANVIGANPMNARDSFNYRFLKKDNWNVLSKDERANWKMNHSKWKDFYTYESSLFSVEEEDFTLSVNPVLCFDMGYDKDSSEQVFRNTRGVEVRGNIADKISFYSFVSENQFRYPPAYEEWMNARSVVPGAGFIKPFGSRAKDFFVARGYFVVRPIKQITMQFGHDRNFIGNGYRSMILSDFSKENLSLKIRWKFWRVEYMNLFSQYTDGTGKGSVKKYGAFHYLNLNVIPGKLDIGAFEHVVFARTGGYEINYMNPIIFYRAVEHGLNSTDNALLGGDFRFIPRKGVMVYGQFVLDEFHKKEMFARSHAWVNKWASQFGVKYFNVLKVQNLDLQVESNVARPYTYTHFLVSQNYTNYNQSLAHPVGTNFRELLAVAYYQIKPRWNLSVKYFHIMHGADSTISATTTHFGGEILNDYYNRAKDDNVKIGSGLKEHIQILDLTCSYQFYHRTFLDFRIVKQSNVRQSPLISNSSFVFYLCLRMNVDRTSLDF
ncbi:MAG: hypothetical protein GC181_09295 [Bacteroidetes bacterium]|nr:hypothetical protein [Bacteroidota bacterium]